MSRLTDEQLIRISYAAMVDAGAQLEDSVDDVIAGFVTGHEDALHTLAAFRAVAEAAVASAILEGYALVPTNLTAENGARLALSGEFFVEVGCVCTGCDGQGYGESDSEDDECEACQGTGEVANIAMIGWPTIKEIWSAGVEHFKAANDGAAMNPIPTPYRFTDIRWMLPGVARDAAFAWPTTWKTLEVMIYYNEHEEARVALTPIVDFFGLSRDQQREKVCANAKYGSKVEMVPCMGMNDHLDTSIELGALPEYLLSLSAEDVRHSGNYGTAPMLEWLQSIWTSRTTNQLDVESRKCC